MIRAVYFDSPKNVAEAVVVRNLRIIDQSFAYKSIKCIWYTFCLFNHGYMLVVNGSIQ